MFAADGDALSSARTERLRYLGMAFRPGYGAGGGTRWNVAANIDATAC